MSEAILAVGAAQLAVAVAALTGGALDRTSTTVVLVSPAVAAEVQPELSAAAKVLAQRHGLRLVHLNEVLAPFHPLGWRAADLSPAEVRSAWSGAGGLTPMDVLHCVGAADAPQRGLVRVFGATRRRVVATPRSAGVSLRRRSGTGLIAGAGPGLALLCRLRGVDAGLVRARRIAQVTAELAELGVVEPGPARVIAVWQPGLWRGFISGPAPEAPTSPTGPEPQPAPDSVESLHDFIRLSIERIDAERGAGSGGPVG